ncbi:MAG: thiamine pyrophosphokinase [Mucilaginibacter sp.]|uniref:thiamine pyrophosphokinase n=1 Tax=Mucilaginibacter sp. TaxID=1882438 RepID=UPI00326685A3
MSSHHIIREKQEPALLVLGLNNFEDDWLGQLLEWSPTLMVTADTAEQLNAFGVKFDVVVGDGEVELQSDIKYVSHKGETVTEAALKYLTDNGYPAVNVVTDDLVLGDYLPYASQINIVIFNAGKKIYPVTTGFAKWKPAGDVIAVMSNVSDMTSTGLEPIGESQYQTISDGFFTLQFKEPFIFIAESI